MHPLPRLNGEVWKTMAPIVTDPQNGIVQTEWKDTGYLFGQVQNVQASIVRRFTVTLSPQAEGSTVTVRMDTKRCAQGGFTIDGKDVRGPCEKLSVIPEKFHEEVDALGGKPQQSLAKGAPAAN